MVHRIGPTPQISQPVSNTPEDVRALGRALVTDSIDLRAAILSQLPPGQGTNPAFSVHKNSTNQTGIASGVATQVTWSTELYNLGGFFSSNVWTPPVGLIILAAGVQLAATTPGNLQSGFLHNVTITKNGSVVFFKGIRPKGDSVSVSGLVSIQDRANGTDSYGVAASAFTTAGTVFVDGNPVTTYFMGAWLSS